MAYLKDIATVIRSKNAGPFEFTMDILFDSEEKYRKVLESGVISRNLISGLYHIEEDKIITLDSYDAARAVKITLPRPRKQGSIGETDMHAAQQHVFSKSYCLQMEVWITACLKTRFRLYVR